MAEALKLPSASVRFTESGRSRLGRAIPLHFAGTGSYAPPRVVTNEDLAHLGCDSQWIIQRTGIQQRRFAEDSQAASDLGYLAATDCLERARVVAKDVDLLLVATITPDHSTPSTACILQKRLGCIAPAMDVNAACSGFIYALITAAQFVHSGAARNALVVGTEVMSRTIQPADLKTYPLFGDGAGAILLQGPQASEESVTRYANSTMENGSSSTRGPSGILAFTLGSEGDTAALCTPAGGSREPITSQTLEAGRQFMRMDGRTVFKWAVRCIVDSCLDVVTAAGYRMEDVDLLVMHQANIRIMDAAVTAFRIPSDRVMVNLDRYGNTSAASIPMALDEANRQGRLARGNLVLLCGFGAGLTWGTALLRW